MGVRPLKFSLQVTPTPALPLKWEGVKTERHYPKI